MKKILTTFFAIMLLFTAIFSVGCSSNDNFEKREKAKYIFENELPKIEVEVDGYSLIKIDRTEFYGQNNGTVDNVNYTSKLYKKYVKIIREDGAERVLKSEKFVGTSETYNKLYNLYGDIFDNSRFHFRCAQFVENKIFIIAVGSDEAIERYFWPNMFFIYDFDTNTLKYCGYAFEDEYPTKLMGIDGPYYFNMPEDNFYKVVKDI